jgi:hypothetical protein
MYIKKSMIDFLKLKITFSVLGKKGGIGNKNGDGF